jgi:hypothetical protein
MRATRIQRQLDLRVGNGGAGERRQVHPTTFEGTFVDVAKAQPAARLAPAPSTLSAAGGVHPASVEVAASRRNHTRVGGSGLSPFQFTPSPSASTPLPIAAATPPPLSAVAAAMTSIPAAVTLLDGHILGPPALAASPTRHQQQLQPVRASPQPKQQQHLLSTGAPSPGPTKRAGLALSPTHVSTQRQVRHLPSLEEVAREHLERSADDGSGDAVASDDQRSVATVASIGQLLLQHSRMGFRGAASAALDVSTAHSSSPPRWLPPMASSPSPGGPHAMSPTERGSRAAVEDESRMTDRRIAAMRQDAVAQAAALNAASYTNRRTAKLLAAGPGRGTHGASGFAHSAGPSDGLLTPAEYEALQGLLNQHALRQARLAEAVAAAAPPAGG